MTTSANQLMELRPLVERYRVCWDVWPEYVMVGSERRQIGFELELSGTHAPGAHNPTPGCAYCKEVFSALLSIAEWIRPAEGRPTRYDFQPYEMKIHYSQNRSFRPDVNLSIKILHRQGGFDLVDPCEKRCLSEMEEKLRQIGACHGSWFGSRQAS